jgi:hypothetical protein
VTERKVHVVVVTAKLRRVLATGLTVSAIVVFAAGVLVGRGRTS